MFSNICSQNSKGTWPLLLWHIQLNLDFEMRRDQWLGKCLTWKSSLEWNIINNNNLKIIFPRNLLAPWIEQFPTPPYQWWIHSSSITPTFWHETPWNRFVTKWISIFNSQETRRCSRAVLYIINLLVEFCICLQSMA